jgi:hypothetical protein
VSGEPEVRALAVSAGLRSHASVAEAERGDITEPTPAIADGQRASQHLVPAREVPPSGRGAYGLSGAAGSAGGAGVAGGVGGATGRSAGSDPASSRTPTTQMPTARPSAAPEQWPGQFPGQPPPPAYLAAQVDPRWTRTETGGFSVTPRAASGGRGPADAAWTGDFGKESTRVRPRRKRAVSGAAGWAVRIAAIALLVGGLAYGAYLYLPTATVSLTPTTQRFGPLTVTITADPNVAVADSKSGKVPAEHVPLPLAASGTFPGTGSEVTQARAQGAVMFRSKNTVTQVIVPQGTVLSTPDGIEFETLEAAVLPKANFDTGEPGTATVPIRAVRPGTSGNVDAGTITEVPTSLSDQQVVASNDTSTSGGRRDVTTVVTREDYDAAVAALTAQLETDLAAALADPVNTPRGLTLYPETAALGRLSMSAAAGDVVGTKVDSFDLSVESQAIVLAVDEALIASVAGDQLEDAAPIGVRVFPETITTRLSPGVVKGNLIAYEVVAEARQYTPVDAGRLEESIRGKTLSEARSILEPFGTVVLTVWPDFIPTVPDDARRINLTVENPEIPR